MGPPEYSKIAIGVTAATGVVLVSFLLLKKFGFQSKSNNTQRRSSNNVPSSGETGKVLSAGEKSGTKKTHSADHNVKNENFEEKLEGYLPEENKELPDNGGGNLNQSYDGQNQNSFIIIGEDEARLPDADPAHTEILGKDVDVELPGEGKKPKKSDRSSDESSYDVIEDDRLEETADEGNNGEGRDGAQNVFEEKKDGDPVAEDIKPPEESFSDLNETSMVLIEPGDRNVNKQSETSIYSATVSEQLGFSQSEDMTISEDQDLTTDVGEKFEEGTETTRKEEDEANFSVLDEDNTLVFGQDAIPDDDKSAEGDISQEQDLSIINSGRQLGSGEKQLEEEPNAQVIPLYNPILTAASDAKSGNSQAGDIPQDSETFDPAEVAAVISKCQSSPMNITKADIFYLVDLLRKRNPELHSAVLDCLIRVAAFTHNIANIRESGCPEVIVQQVQDFCRAVVSGDGQAEKTLNSVCQVLTNLSMDPKTQEELGDAIPALIDLIQIRPVGDAIILSALRPLVNLSSEKTYHEMYRQLIPTLYQLLESGTHMAKVQSLKVLVNLSLDEDVVPYLLAAKAPSNLIEFLDRPMANDLILRAVTLIANIHTVIDTLQLTAASLPVDEKAASPETMYMALTGIDRLPTLRSKVFRLTRHEDEDVVYQASKLYNLISETSA